MMLPAVFYNYAFQLIHQDDNMIKKDSHNANKAKTLFIMFHLINYYENIMKSNPLCNMPNLLNYRFHRHNKYFVRLNCKYKNTYP